MMTGKSKPEIVWIVFEFILGFEGKRNPYVVTVCKTRQVAEKFIIEELGNNPTRLLYFRGWKVRE